MPVTRVAKPADAEALSAVLAEAFAGYRDWAPSDWAPPVPSAAEASRLAGALARPDVWCVVALDDEEVIGHVALSLLTVEDPQPPPPGTINLWQLFVRPEWQGQGVATELDGGGGWGSSAAWFQPDAAVDAAGRGPRPVLLWT